jgi:chromatin remodeling complex protein RSC6
MTTILESNSIQKEENDDFTNIEINECENNNEENLEKSEENKEMSNVDVLYEKLQKQFNDSNLILKTLQNNVKILYKEFVKERKELIKKSNKNKKKKKKNSLSGFAIPSKITKELADFLGLDENIEIPRTDVTKLICKYIKDNHLQNPENKKIIIPDEKFKKLFEGQLDENNKLEFFNIQTYLKCHFIKSKPEEEQE